jgi:hypothetical protein
MKAPRRPIGFRGILAFPLVVSVSERGFETPTATARSSGRMRRLCLRVWDVDECRYDSGIGQTKPSTENRTSHRVSSGASECDSCLRTGDLVAVVKPCGTDFSAAWENGGRTEGRRLIRSSSVAAEALGPVLVPPPGTGRIGSPRRTGSRRSRQCGAKLATLLLPPTQPARDLSR